MTANRPPPVRAAATRDRRGRPPRDISASQTPPIMTAATTNPRRRFMAQARRPPDTARQYTRRRAVTPREPDRPAGGAGGAPGLPPVEAQQGVELPPGLLPRRLVPRPRDGVAAVPEREQFLALPLQQPGDGPQPLGRLAVGLGLGQRADLGKLPVHGVERSQDGGQHRPRRPLVVEPFRLAVGQE